MKPIRKSVWSLIFILVATSVTVFFWWDVVSQPGTIALELGPDASKNYFTFLYQSLYGHGAWIKGMNYPYGEHIVYTDGQPFLSIPLSLLRDILSLNVERGLAILHLSIIAGFLLAIIFTYKILLHFRVNQIFSIAGSVLILLLSPQIVRVFGHFGLSYMFVIPAVFYWNTKYHDSSKIKYPVFVFLLGAYMSFAHPYFAGVLFIWVALYCTGYLLFNRNSFRNTIKHLAPLASSVVLVIVFVKAVMFLTDPVKDRPTNPIGTLSACTTGDDIFTSDMSPIWNYLHSKQIVGSLSGGMHEGFAYPGIVVLVILIVSIITFFVRRIKRSKDSAVVSEGSKLSPVWLFMAFGALLLGMGAPFVWNMEWLLDYVSIFRQFRSLGRFSWIFYYVASVYAVVIFYRWAVANHAKGRKVIGYTAAILALIVWSFEATGYKKYIDTRSDGAFSKYCFLYSKIERNWNVYLEEKKYKPSDFQAILALPYFHNGSEKILLFDDNIGWLFVLSVKTALQLQLPLVNANMSRSSWSQTFDQVRIAAGPLADKPLIKVNDQRPFLVVTRDKDTAFNPDIRYLLQNCERIGNHNDLNAYKLYPLQLRRSDSIYRQSLLPLYNSLQQGDTCIGCNGSWYIDHFDDNPQSAFFSSGGAATIANDKHVLFDRPFTPSYPDTLYEFSAWVHVNHDDFRAPYFEIECYDDKGAMIKSVIARATFSVDNHSFWLRVSNYFEMPANCKKVRCTINEAKTSKYWALDELLIRPATGTVMSKFKNGQALVNNHIYKKN